MGIEEKIKQMRQEHKADEKVRRVDLKARCNDADISLGDIVSASATKITISAVSHWFANRTTSQNIDKAVKELLADAEKRGGQ